MLDAMASCASTDGLVYLVTASEGDERDHDGLSEEARVKDLVPDPVAFPNAAALKADRILGRLKTTTPSLVWSARVAMKRQCTDQGPVGGSLQCMSAFGML